MNNKIIGGLLATLVVVAAICPPNVAEWETLIPLWGPLEHIRSNNRWICSGLVILLILLAMSRGVGGFTQGGWKLIIPLAGLHGLVFAKNFGAVREQAFYFLGGAILLMMATALTAGMMKERARQATAKPAWWPLVLAAFGFIGINLIQYRLGPDATMLVSNRFSGVTSNPQMYALSLAIIVPALLYQYTSDRRLWSRALVLAAFLAALYMALLSGSRLSLLLSGLAVLFYFRAKIMQLAIFLIPAVIAAMFWLHYHEAIPTDPDSHITSLENTRSQVWSDQLALITQHPLFGKPLAPGERMGFGENSYLAAGATLGVPGLLLIGAFAFFLAGLIVRLIRLEQVKGWKPELALPIAVLATCLVGAFFEAFLMGVYTLPLTALLYTAFTTELFLTPWSGVRPPGSKRSKRRPGRRNATDEEQSRPELPTGTNASGSIPAEERREGRWQRAGRRNFHKLQTDKPGATTIRR